MGHEHRSGLRVYWKPVFERWLKECVCVTNLRCRCALAGRCTAPVRDRFSRAPRPRVRSAGEWLATAEASPSALSLRWLDEAVALVGEVTDGPLDIAIVRYCPAR
ncbi:MAG: hypothetical protein J07HQW2_03884 [Haloquadratum walsbyi J07HQW2]|uniref:Uncharacterized protein n=1 Tax=Haloquadratum walsbyi J07HQW2 TaxID=1238425 RepID=U1NKB4_9EURY|nr:MAG: hypothetical protein J07HQW2_03884 [Haloquadratum walsbyi J07HQW2]